MRAPIAALAVMIALPWLAAVAVACGQAGSGELQGEGVRPIQQKTIERVLEKHTDSLMALPGVVGTAQGLCSGQPCIRVFVVEKTPELLNRIPSDIEGYPVSVEETGEIKPLEPG